MPFVEGAAPMWGMSRGGAFGVYQQVTTGGSFFVGGDIHEGGLYGWGSTPGQGGDVTPERQEWLLGWRHSPECKAPKRNHKCTPHEKALRFVFCNVACTPHTFLLFWLPTA